MGDTTRIDDLIRQNDVLTNTLTFWDMTALEIAVLNNKQKAATPLLQLIISRMESINISNNNRSSPLQRVVQSNHIRTAVLLIENGEK